MNSIHRSLLVAVLSIGAFSQPAQAQRSFGFSRTNTLVSLAANDAVQKDLGVSGDAVGKLRSLGDDYRAASQKEATALGIDYGAISDLPQAERTAEMRIITEKTAHMNRKLTEEFLPKLQGLLSAEQIQRLKQIQIQANGIDAWTEPEVAAALELNNDQRQKLVELRNEYLRKQQQLDGDFQERFAKIRELNVERDKKAVELLTANQTTKLAALKGQPFDTNQLSFGRRGKN